MAFSFPIEFNKPKCYIYLILLPIFRTTNDFIRRYFPEFFASSFLRLFLMFFSKSLASILILIERYRMKKNINIKSILIFKNDEDKIITFETNKKHILWIYFILIIYIINVLFASINYSKFCYNNEMNKFDDLFVNIELFTLFTSLILFERLILKIHFYRHHIIALFFNFLSIIYIIFITIINYDWKVYKIKDLIIVFIIIFQSQILQSFAFIIAKKLNNSYFINIHLIMVFEGIIGMIILILFDIFYVFIFKYDNYFIIKLGNPKYEGLYFIKFIIIVVYCICICGLNKSYLDITEKVSPIYTMVGKGLSDFTIAIAQLIEKSLINKQSIKFNAEAIFFYFFSILGNCIFCEIIVLNFCDLNKNTNKKIHQRATKEISLIEKFFNYFEK